MARYGLAELCSPWLFSLDLQFARRRALPRLHPDLGTAARESSRQSRPILSEVTDRFNR